MHENKEIDFLAIDIASLSANEYEKAGVLLKEKIHFDLTADEKKLFSKTWLYLRLAREIYMSTRLLTNCRTIIRFKESIAPIARSHSW